jgi:hypothetical protein
MNALLDAALDYARRGYSVFPLHNPEADKCSCKNSNCDCAGKHPRTPHGFKDATVDESIITGWWTEWPNANIGIATGTPGLSVIDTDSADAELRIRAMCADSCDFETIPRSRTGRGSQFFFAQTIPLKSRNGILEKVDFKGDGGYIVAPPSRHKNGKIYTWEVQLTQQLPSLPYALLELIQNGNEHTEKHARFDSVRALSGLPDGERNVQLFKFACSLRSANIPQDHTEYLILHSARKCQPPLPDQRALQIVADVYDRYPPGHSQDFTSDYTDPLSEVKWNRERNAGDLQRQAKESSEPLLDYLPVLGQDGFIVKKWSHLIAGYPRVGKTDFINHIIAEWREERILYFTEEAEVLWKARLIALPPLYDHVTLIYALGMTRDEIVQRIREGQETVVIIDTVRNLLGLKDETDNSEVARCLNPVIATARMSQKTFIAVHHSRKGGGEHGEGITGAHAFMGVVDIALEIIREANNDESRRRIIKGWGRVIEVEKLVYELQPDKSMVALGSPAQVALDQVKQRACELLTDELQETKAILEAFSGNKPSIDQLTRALVSLANEGLAERDPPMSEGKRQGKIYKWRRVQDFTSDAPLYKSEVKFEETTSGEVH